jgi:hypothetical protein
MKMMWLMELAKVPFALKLAVTEVSAVSVKLQVSDPVQPPDHPVNLELALGVAVRTTAVPLVKLALHVEPQLMPAISLVTVPPPVPVS